MKGHRIPYVLVAAMCAVVTTATAAAQAADRQAASQATQAAQETRTDPLAEIRALIESGQAKAAVARLQAQPAPLDPSSTLLLGVALYHADDFARAIEVLKPLVEKLPDTGPEREEADQVLGLSFYAAGRFPEALPLLERTRARKGDSRELSLYLGNAYSQTRQPDRAREAFARVFDVPPASAGAHVLTAQMMQRLELEDLASAELRAAIAADPNVPHAHYLLAQMALFRNRLDEAIALSRKELAINPANAMAYYQIGDALTRQSKWAEAIAALQQSLWINPYYSGPYILLGKAYSKLGQPATAEGMLRRAIAYDPNNRTAHYLLGQLLQQLGRTQEAEQAFARAEQLQGQEGR